MRTMIFTLLMFAGTLAVQAGNPGEEVVIKVKPTQSKIEWVAKKVTGKHNGTIAIHEGALTFKDQILTGGTFEIDMKSIAVTDLEGGPKAKLENHLRSDDFFSVEKFPKATLVITDAKVIDNGIYSIKGNLTIKGITHPVAFTANVSTVNSVVKASADIKIDRTLYDVRYGSGKFFQDLGNSMIDDEFNLAVTLVAGEES